MRRAHFSLEFGIFFQESFESEELVSHALHFVEFISSDDELHPAITLSQQFDPISNFGLFPVRATDETPFNAEDIMNYLFLVRLLTSMPMANTATSTKVFSS